MFKSKSYSRLLQKKELTSAHTEVAPFFLLIKEEIAQLEKFVTKGERPLWEIWPKFVREMLVMERSKETISSIRDVVKFFVRTGHFYTVESLKRKDLKAFLQEHKEARGWKSWTYNTYLMRMRSFIDYLVEEEYLDRNPAKELRRCGHMAEYQPTLTAPEVNQIVGYLNCNLKNNFVALRDIIFILVLATTGCRLSEALRINISDLDFSRNTWNIRPSKGGKNRIISLSQNLMFYLKIYLEKRKTLNRNEEELFISIHKCGKAWTQSGVRKMVERLRNATGIKKLTCHSLRRYVATSLAEQGVPMLKIQTLFSHKRSSTTFAYINSSSPKYLAECLTPLDNALTSLSQIPADVSQSTPPSV